MALLPKESSGPKRRPPWRGVVVGAFAAIVFVCAVAVSAWATRDTPRGVPDARRHRVLDAGVVVAVAADAGFADAGFVDAGSDVEGPLPEPDAGPVHVAPEGPPVAAKEVAAAIVPVVEECLRGALRFDPSLGGKATVRVVVGNGTLATTMPGAPSPVLASCVAEKRVPFDTPSMPVTVQAKLRLDGRRVTATVLSAELVP